MTSRRPRSLRPEEKALWDQVRQSAVPLHRPTKEVLNNAVKVASPTPPKLEIPSFRVGQNAGRAIFPQSVLRPASVNMDSKKLTRMKKGKLSPEARIDLHGMTLVEAHPALTGFIFSAQSAGLRLVLVITGKGRPNSGGHDILINKGVLKHQVPTWLSQAILAPLVQQVVDAHSKHGGGGALYVYLRKRG